MCGRFTLITDLNYLKRRFQIENNITFDYSPRYNVAPSQQVFAVIHDGKIRRGGLLRWGLIPSWAKNSSIGYKMINARSETLEEKPSFNRLIVRNRCFVLADSFYEWKRDGKEKKPVRIRMKNEEPFAMAGLWDRWQSPEGEVVHSCTIVTTKSNQLMNKIHHRMPVILTPETEKLWLDRTITHMASLQPAMVPFESEKMEAYPVLNIVNSANNEVPECIEPVTEG